VLPGNHVFVLTGLFRYAHDEDELASVLGHEMAHNISRHAGERVSESILLAIVRRLALVIDPSGILFSFLIPAEQLFFTLPHNREHEMEADRIGIILASEACYDPNAAKRVFSRMKEDTEHGNRGQATPPEWLSTHPGYDTRLSLFDQWMPDALERFNRDSGNKCRSMRAEMKRARRLASEAHDRQEGGKM
jgi:predicted Zn-dependent protease